MSNARIAIRLQPRAHRDELVGIRDGVLIARVGAPALEGRANRALCRLIAAQLHIAPSRVSIVRGEHARAKLVEVDGLDQAACESALGL